MNFRTVSRTMMSKWRIGLLSLVLSLNSNLSYADNTPLGDLMSKVLAVLVLFILVGVVASQFVPMKNGYTSVVQRIVFGIGGVAIGIVSTMLFFRLMLFLEYVPPWF